jgi:hypothetical protein
MFELLMSGDAVVPDHDAAVAQCQREWGLPAVHRNWTATPPGSGAKWSFARLQRDRRLAPTALEILGIPYGSSDPEERPAGYAYLPEIAASQGDRPVRNHSTVVTSADLGAVAERLTATGGRFRLDEADANLPFSRLWIGFSHQDADRYEPETDGGLRLEVLPHDRLGMPEPGLAPEVVPLGPGAPVRMVARTVLVSDLDAVLLALDRHFGWRPETVDDGDDGVRRARFAFTYPDSAVLEIAQPDGRSAEGEFLRQWGPGPFSVRIAVNGLDELQRHFVAEQVPHRILPPAGGKETSRLFRPPERALGTAFEFVESS